MEKTEFTITKVLTETYKLRPQSTCGWADITIDSNGNAGRIQISSDYGDWQYYWGACGCSFKEFLSSIHIDYFAVKVGEHNHFDHEATRRAVMNDIQQQCTDCEIEEYDVERLREEVEEILGNSTDLRDYMTQMCESALINELLYDEPVDINYQTGISPSFAMFFNGPWKAFVECLAKEKETTDLITP